MESAKRVMNGSKGEVWLNDDYVAECYKCQAKVAFNKEDINLAGTMAVDSKVTSTKGTGSLGMYKVSSRMAAAIGDAINAGRDLRFTIITKLDDPDAYGAERIAIHNVSFDDLTLADWEAAKVGRVEAPFTFTNYKYLDL